MIACLFAFGKIDLSKSWQIALKANLLCLGAAVILYLSTVIVNARRWQLLASAVGLNKPLGKLVQFCFVGMFFNLFLPSTVGGDFTRCYYLSKGEGKYGAATYSVLADRVVGISVLFLFASLGILLGPGGSGIPWHLKAPILAASFAVFFILPMMPKLTRKILGEANWISRRFNNSSAAVYWQNKPLIAVCLIWSVVMQVMMVGCHILLAYALGITNVPLWYYFVFYPSVAVLGFVTPSFNGIGIREWAYTYFLTMMQVDNSRALAYAIMWLGLITFGSLVGGLVYLAGHFQISKAEVEMLQHESEEAVV